MDPVFDAQFREMRAALLGRDVDIDVAYRPNGDVDYVYATGRLLTRDRDGNIDRISTVLGEGVTRIDPEERRSDGGLAVLQLERHSVPEALRLIDVNDRERLGRVGPRTLSDTPVGADTIVHITRLCNAVEPEVAPFQPAAGPKLPWPPVRPGGGGAGVLIGICDTGLLENISLAVYPWLDGVRGEPDSLPPPDHTGNPVIGLYDGHGTFVAGVARSIAPASDVIVTDHMTSSGGELESEFVAKLTALLRADRVPDIINISAGTYTWDDLPSVAFQAFFDDVLSHHPDVVLVASAGNDGIDRPLWPAAFEWAVGVGALGPDETERAWFSNFGPWVDVYTLGEGVINIFPSGRYVYNEPPKRPSAQTFTGMARWDGTSFAAPLVAGLLAERMQRAGERAPAALAALRGDLTALGPGALPAFGSDKSIS